MNASGKLETGKTAHVSTGMEQNIPALYFYPTTNTLYIWFTHLADKRKYPDCALCAKNGKL